MAAVKPCAGGYAPRLVVAKPVPCEPRTGW